MRKVISIVLTLALIMGGMFTAPVATVAKAATEPSTPVFKITEVAAGNGLQSDESQAEQAADFVSTTQPARFAPNGEEIDKSKSPLGANSMVLDKIYQIAYAQKVGGDNAQFVLDHAYSPGSFDVAKYTSRLTNGLPEAGLNWNVNYRKLVPADVNGDLLQEVVTVGLVPNKGAASLQFFVSDYNNIQTVGPVGRQQTRPVSSSIYTITTSEPYVANYDNPLVAIKAASGDFDRDGLEEIAISVGNSLYVVKVTMDGMNVLSSKHDFAGRIGDVEAADVNKDGYPELLVTIDNTKVASLIIYSTADLNNPDQTIVLYSAENRLAFSTADVYTGDILGEGADVIVIGGRVGNAPALSYIRYDPKSDSYSTSLPKVYTLASESNRVSPAVKSRLDVKTVSLSAPVPGTPDSVVLGGNLFTYKVEADDFERVSLSSADIDGGFINAGYYVDNSLDSITNTGSGAETYIIDTLVGNFNGNKDGKEQIVMLHYNVYGGSEYIFLTSVSEDADKNINSSLSEQWRKGEPDIYPGIAAPYVLDKGVKVEFLPSKSKFVFSDPVITAVLGVPPYYKELENEYTSSLWSVGTTYGKTEQQDDSESTGVVAQAGMSIGFNQEFSVLGVKLFELELETEIEKSISSSWTTGKSISKSISYTVLHEHHGVVVMVVPYDVYFYKVSTKDENGQILEEEMTLEVPYEPRTSIMPVTLYNDIAKDMENAPLIGTEVLGGAVVGDPRSYPRTSAELSNVEGDDGVLMVGDKEDNSIDLSGIGNSTPEQSISLTDTSGRESEEQQTVGLSFKVTLGGFTAGAGFSAGSTRTVTVTSSKSTTHTGSVASVPYPRYQFEWALVAYDYEVPAGDSTQAFKVINYLVRPLGWPEGQFPPPVPENLRVETNSLDGITIEWDQAKGATGYRILRSTSASGQFSEIGNLQGQTSMIFTDSNITSDQIYYYKIWPYNAKDGVPTEPLEVRSLFVKEIRITKQPKLIYEEGDALDLSQLSISLIISDDTTQNIAFADFDEKNITTSPANSIALTLSDTGVPITVSYDNRPDDPSGTEWRRSANTGNLTVNAKSPYDFTLDVRFTTGWNNRITTVLPRSQLLTANMNLTNKSKETQDIVVILALYSDGGHMIMLRNASRRVAAGADVTVVYQLPLPNYVNGYRAKAFALDGTSLLNTTLTPKTPCIEIQGY